MAMGVLDQPVMAFRPRRFRMPYAAVTLVGLIILWQLAVIAFKVPTYLLPSPFAIGRDLALNFPLILSQSWVTVFEVVFGFAISVLIGLPIAVLVTYSDTFDRYVYPLIVGSQVIPKVAIAPILLAWFGFGMTPKITVVVLIAFFPIVVNSVVGLRSTSPQMIHLARSMGSSAWQIFWRFRMPQALPSIFAGMKMASVLSVTGAIVGEFVGADSGLGFIIVTAGSDFHIDRQFSAIILLCAIGFVFFALIGWVERKLLPWHISVRGHQAD